MAVVGGLMEAGPLLVTTPPPSSKALPICQYSCFLTFHPFHILICLYSLPTVDPNDLIHSKVESINHRDKVFIGVFWRLYLKLLLSSMKKKETQWINHSNIRRWDVSKSFEIILLGDSRSVGMVVGLALVVDLVGSLPDSRDRSLGNYSSFLGLARDFTIWATTKILTRSNFSQNWNILALQLLKESASQMFFWNKYYFD